MSKQCARMARPLWDSKAIYLDGMLGPCVVWLTPLCLSDTLLSMSHLLSLLRLAVRDRLVAFNAAGWLVAQFIARQHPVKRRT